MTDDTDHPYEGYSDFADEAPPPPVVQARRAADPGSRPQADQGRLDRTQGGAGRLVAGGAVLPRQSPPDDRGPPSTWPVRRPNPALPGSPRTSGGPPRVDARTEIPRPRPLGQQPSRDAVPVAQGQATRPPAEQPRAPARVDARTAGGDDMEMPQAIPKPNVRLPGGPGKFAMPRSGATPPPPTEARLAEIREASKARLGEGRTWKGLAPGQEPTRTAGTVESYKKRGKQLVVRFRRERNIGRDVEEFDPMDFAVWVLSLRGGLKPSSWRSYRQATLMTLGGIASTRAEEAIALVENDAPGDRAMRLVDEPREDAVPGQGQMTSSLKAKFLKYEDYHRIDAYLRLKRRSEAADVLRDWLQAGVATGLRPSEWKATQVTRVEDRSHPTGRRAYLYVINAKATNGRGNGVVRTLDLSNLSEGSLAVIERMSEAGVRAYAAGKFDDLQSHCAQIMYQTCLSMFEKMRKRGLCYALYSCRHQFIANQKALSLSNEEISAMAGHIVDETAAHHYGRRKSGWSPDKIVDRVRGVPEEIATVRKVLVLHEERARLQAIVDKGMPKAPVPAPVDIDDDAEGPQDATMG